jgi:hypothetical protein
MRLNTIVKRLNIITLFIFILLLVACDAQRRDRFLDQTLVKGSSDGYAQDIYNNGGNQFGNEDDFITSTDPQNLGPGFEYCDLGFQYNISAIGYFGMCKHATYENIYKVKFQTTPPPQGMCFVPMHRQADGSSFRVGVAECTQSTNIMPNYVLTVPFMSKELPNIINSVIVIHSSSLNSFLECQNAKTNFYAANGCNCNEYGCNKQICYQADAHAQQVCNNFISNHGNKYRQVNF